MLIPEKNKKKNLEKSVKLFLKNRIKRKLSFPLFLEQVQNISKNIKDVSRILKKLDGLHEGVSSSGGGGSSSEQNRALGRVQDLLTTAVEQIQDLPK